ncbi:E3 ubiquitin ligase BIG BROTHER [Acorus gramineus]|uniref:E3 ubiquitin ligase BIG BROTHER n=1 Tax=Acorus gramineus TaxID=55184 RepID=A0AAV9A9H3_ACOGR|nr:E3 ubiquitin ligase BIG BROTHER [Acorus gramineus]
MWNATSTCTCISANAYNSTHAQEEARVAIRITTRTTALSRHGTTTTRVANSVVSAIETVHLRPEDVDFCTAARSNAGLAALSSCIWRMLRRYGIIGVAARWSRLEQEYTQHVCSAAHHYRQSGYQSANFEFDLQFDVNCTYHGEAREAAAAWEEWVARMRCGYEAGAAPAGEASMGHLTAYPFDGASSSKNYACAVCLGKLEVKEWVVAMPCCHLYHFECLQRWLRCWGVCPVCQYVMS